MVAGIAMTYKIGASTEAMTITARMLTLVTAIIVTNNGAMKKYMMRTTRRMKVTGIIIGICLSQGLR